MVGLSIYLIKQLYIEKSEVLSAYGYSISQFLFSVG